MMSTNQESTAMQRFGSHLLVSALLATTALLGTPLAQAQSASPALYESFGKGEGVKRLVDDFVTRVTTDARISAMFKDTNLKRLREKLEEQFCSVMGGGCTYTGDDMKEVHKSLGIHMADFNALVEDLQAAMDQQGIPFSQQNALLAQLAPMYKDINTSH